MTRKTTTTMLPFCEVCQLPSKLDVVNVNKDIIGKQEREWVCIVGGGLMHDCVFLCVERGTAINNQLMLIVTSFGCGTFYTDLEVRYMTVSVKHILTILR